METYIHLAITIAMLFTSCLWLGIVAMLKPLKKASSNIPDGSKDKVLLIIPCVFHERLEENLRFFSSLYHPNIRCVFVSGSASEPAASVIQKVVQDFDHCRHVVAGEAKICSQKNKNLLAAIEAEKEYAPDFFVFCDDDCRPRDKNWVLHFVEYLKNPKIGAVTSFRHVYLPPKTALSDFFYFFSTTYQRASMRLTSAFVWGGAFGLRREFFEAHQMDKIWGSTAVDDIVTSQIVTKAGLKIKFVQEAMLHEEADQQSYSRYQSWMVRQFQYLYFYARWGYWLSFTILASTLAAYFILPIQLYTGTLTFSTAATILCVSSVTLLAGVIAFMVQGFSLPKRIFCTLCCPLVVGTTVLGLLQCLITDQIKWKHKAYRIASDGSIAEVINLLPTLPKGKTAVDVTETEVNLG